jgi:uncharacterized protein (UPF0332 family)
MTPEQQALLDKSQRSIDAVQSLIQEGFYDFAVSRAYYAMFYVAEALLDKEGLSFSSHAAVISAFGQHLARAGKIPTDFHRQLIEAQSQRTRADYDPEPNLSQSDAEKILNQAQIFLITATNNLTSG